MAFRLKDTILFNLVKEHGHRTFDMNETLTQLRHFGGVMGLMSWGISSRINILNRGLLLTVNGNHHKGDVLIVLDGSDTYTIFILNVRGRVLDEYRDVYFDDLFNIIDNRIERIPEYIR